MSAWPSLQWFFAVVLVLLGGAWVIVPFFWTRRGAAEPREPAAAGERGTAVGRAAASDGAPGGAVNGERRAELLRRKALAYAELKELEFDYKVGKLSESDYEQLAQVQRATALEILRQLEAQQEPDDLDRAIDAEVSRRLQARRAAQAAGGRGGGARATQLADLSPAGHGAAPPSEETSAARAGGAAAIPPGVCGGCGGELPPEARFCSQCGAPAGARCAACQQPLTQGDRFCSQCGAPVAV
ncbi:MAG: zinc ribbon domain-containing protein [Candidatus Tectomicrobia bacterium]|nr:zinc ribbon domain-containing protein [Candidatus Tectomicrobia bacterium]